MHGCYTLSAQDGVVEEMGTDKKFYTEILLKKVANNYNIKLLT